MATGQIYIAHPVLGVTVSPHLAHFIESDRDREELTLPLTTLAVLRYAGVIVCAGSTSVWVTDKEDHTSDPIRIRTGPDSVAIRPEWRAELIKALRDMAEMHTEKYFSFAKSQMKI